MSVSALCAPGGKNENQKPFSPFQIRSLKLLLFGSLASWVESDCRLVQHLLYTACPLCPIGHFVLISGILACVPFCELSTEAFFCSPFCHEQLVRMGIMALEKPYWAWCGGLIPVISAAWEAEIGRISVWGQSGQKVSGTPSHQ
jgi:hypothetical protein